MDMHAEDIEMDDYSEQNEAFLQSTATWTRPVRASSAPINGLAVYMKTKYNRLCRRLARSSFGTSVYWIIMILGFLGFALLVSALVFLTVYIWIHSIELVRGHTSPPNTCLPCPTTSRVFTPSLPYTAPASHKSAPLGMLHPANRPFLPENPHYHDDGSSAPSRPIYNASDHEGNLARCASNLNQRLWGGPNTFKATKDMEFVLLLCQYAVYKALEDLFPPPVVPALGRKPWKVFLVAVSALLGVWLLWELGRCCWRRSRGWRRNRSRRGTGC
ncbi:hypothetical protein KCU88_g7324, partial [Aureobasidium melanogenum]